MELEKQFFIAGYILYEYYRYLTKGAHWMEVLEVLEDLGRLFVGLILIGAALLLICGLFGTEAVR